MGSTKSLPIDDEVKQIWSWAIERDNFISITHIPGVLNEEADEQSRKSEERSEWMLNKKDFYTVIKSLEFTPNIDLFASRLNTQLIKLFSYRPDPCCLAVDAFTENWSKLQFYAFPPFAIVNRVLQKIHIEKAFGIVVVPDWPNQTWYS